jgi:hypothetical protein
MPRLATTLALTCALMAAAMPAAAGMRIFSYDPANDLTRRVAGDLTFQFDQHLIFVKLQNIRSTEGRASADLKPADEHVLGAGGLSRLIGGSAQERDLYQVEGDADGLDLIHAFCPGSSRAWLAFGRLVEGRPLRVRVIGDAPQGGPSRLCETLEFYYRGEWKLPPGPEVRGGDLKEPQFPY